MVEASVLPQLAQGRHRVVVGKKPLVAEVGGAAWVPFLLAFVRTTELYSQDPGRLPGPGAR